MSQDKSAAYAHCRQIASSRYENFPVASWLLPRHLRDPIAAIYAFARRADDLADEGDLSAEARREALEDQRRSLRQALHQTEVISDPVLIALTHTIRRHQLPLQLFEDLLDAFVRDTQQSRYADFTELLDYCRQSANPVGRLLLHLQGLDREDWLHSSDALCTALQLLNFLQDVRSDLIDRQRIYLPQEDLRRFGVTESQLEAGEHRAAIDALFEHQLTRCRRLLDNAAPLARDIPGRFGLELRCILTAANLLHRRLSQPRRNRLTRSPRIHARDLPLILISACFRRG